MSEVKLKGSVGFNHALVTLDTIGRKDSKIILEGNSNKVLKTDQKLLATGPNFTMGKVGDRVFLDTDRLGATQASGKSVHIRHIAFDKTTGRILTDTDQDQVKEENIDFVGLITDREILMVIE